jgi:teichoic acid transport system permease protein
VLRRFLEINPGAVYVELVRDALLERHNSYHLEWQVAVVWAAATFVVGFVFFWQAEEQYGRG